MRHAQIFLWTLFFLSLASLAQEINSRSSFDGIIDCGTFHGESAPTYGTGLRYESLDGVDDHVLLPQADPFPLYESNIGFTIALWVKGAPQNGVVFSEGASTTDGVFTIGADTNGKVHIVIEDDDDELSEFNVDETSQGVAFDGTWHHIAFTWDGDDTYLYIDGAEDSHLTSLTGPIDITRSGVGARRDGNGTCCYFAGDVDEVVNHAGALSTGRVLELVATEYELQVDQLPSGETEVSFYLNQDPNQPARIWAWLAGIAAEGGCDVVEVTTVGTDANDAAQTALAISTTGPGNEGVVSFGLTSYFLDGETVDPSGSPHRLLRFRLRPKETGCADCTVRFREGLQMGDHVAGNHTYGGSRYPLLSDPIQTQICGCFESENIGGWGVSNLLAVNTDDASRPRADVTKGYELCSRAWGYGDGSDAARFVYRIHISSNNQLFDFENKVRVDEIIGDGIAGLDVRGNTSGPMPLPQDAHFVSSCARMRRAVGIASSRTNARFQVHRQPRTRHPSWSICRSSSWFNATARLSAAGSAPTTVASRRPSSFRPSAQIFITCRYLLAWHRLPIRTTPRAPSSALSILTRTAIAAPTASTTIRTITWSGSARTSARVVTHKPTTHLETRTRTATEFPTVAMTSRSFHSSTTARANPSGSSADSTATFTTSCASRPSSTPPRTSSSTTSKSSTSSST
jgi:hypothetical protein